MALLKTRPKPALLGKVLTLQIDDELRGRINVALDAAYRQNRELDVQELLLEYLRRTIPTIERQLGIGGSKETPATGVTADAT